MNIVFVIMNAGSGGHTRTAISVGEALSKQGHRITFVTGSDRDSPTLAASGFDVLKVPPSRIGTYDRLGDVIDQLAEENAVNVVHTFAYFGLTELADICRRRRLPLWWTICGEAPLRPLDYDFMKFRNIVSLSQEVKDGLLEQHGLEDGDVTVIPARINVRQVLDNVDSAPDGHFADFRRKYAIAPSSKILFRVARVHASYEESLIQGVEVAKRLNRRGLDVCFVHIGYVQQEEVHSRVKAAVASANEEAGKTVAVSAQDEALSALSYLGMADLVIGTGRGAFEGMLASKPTVVVGVNGFAGVVGAESVQPIAHYNFSGRNVGSRKDFNVSVEEIAGVAETLLTDEDRYRAVGRFGKAYVLGNLDADVAAKKYEALYRASAAAPVLPGRAEIMRSATLFRAKSLWRYLLPESTRARAKALLKAKTSRGLE